VVCTENMSQQELNLLQFTARTVAEASARAPKVMRCEIRDSKFPCILLHDVPDYFSVISFPQIVPVRHTRRKSLPPATLAAVNQSSMVRFTQSGTGSPNMASLANQIDDSPVVFAPLQMLKRKLG
jgi:hypothetical protein